MTTALPCLPLHLAQFKYTLLCTCPCFRFNGLLSGTMWPIVGARLGSLGTVCLPHSKQHPLSLCSTHCFVMPCSYGRPFSLHRVTWSLPLRPDFLPRLLFILRDSARHSGEQSLSLPFLNSFPHRTHSRGCNSRLARSLARTSRRTLRRNLL